MIMAQWFGFSSDIELVRDYDCVKQNRKTTGKARFKGRRAHRILPAKDEKVNHTN
jgi:hypothetical protein